MFRFDRKSIYIILGAVILMNILRRLNSKESILITLVSLLAILIAITFHEFAHAFAADKLGDNTPRSQGRLTLNPLAHIDLVGFALLIAAGFGWGKPVQVNPTKFKRNITMTQGEAIVSVAGPLMNFIIAIISALFMGCIFKFNLFSNVNASMYYLIVMFVLELILINIGLGIFNLIPLPPLDGSKILSSFLPYNARNWFYKNQYVFYIAFVIIWITGIAGIIITPCIQGTAKGLLMLVGKIMNINLNII